MNQVRHAKEDAAEQETDLMSPESDKNDPSLNPLQEEIQRIVEEKIQLQKEKDGDISDEDVPIRLPKSVT